MDQQYRRLIHNLDEFIRKYYIDKIVKGSLYLIGILLSLFLVMVFLEYFLYLSSVPKLILIWSFFLISSFSFGFFILIPLLRLSKLIKRMSHKEAAIIIGNHFPDIDDKLLNTIQLHELHNQIQSDNILLLNASIEQRVLNFGIFRFKKIIRFQLNRKYLKYALPPLLILVVLLIGSPTLIFNPAQRLVYYDSTFVPQAPFEFVLNNERLMAEEGNDFQISMRLKGESIPSDVTILVDGFEYLMRKTSSVDFIYTFENIRNPLKFRFIAGDYFSKEYKLNIVHIPKIIDVSVKVVYPKYIGKSNESFSKISELVLPEGSSLDFNIKSRDADSLLYKLDYSEIFHLNLSQPNFIRFQIDKLRENKVLQFIPLNSEASSTDTLEYQIIIIKDEYPQIKLSEYTDSIFEKRKFFKGIIKDDYGFSSLKMEVDYKTRNENDTILQLPIIIPSNSTSQDFFYFFDFKSLNAVPGSTINYSFLISDNDGINGAKTTRSQVFSFTQKTKEEEINDSEERANSLKSEISSSASEAENIAKKLEDISEKLRGKKNISWEEKKEIEEILKQFEKLQEKLQDHIDQTEQNLLKNQDELNEAEKLQEKQKELQRLMEEILTPEMKQMMEEMKKMMEKNASKEKIEKSLEDMKFDAEFMKEQLDRELEMMKQLKFEQKLQQNIDKLNELQKRQEKLSEEQIKESKEESAEKQDKLNREFQDFKKDMDEIRKENSELKEPNSLKDTKEKEDAIESDMKESSQKLSDGKKNSGQKSQKEAAQKMDELADELESMQSEMQQESQSEDMENLKNILHNLLEISFNQEKLMDKVKYTSNRDPQFPEFIEEQKNIVNDIAMVEDSLNKLAMRNPSISPVVSRELKKIKAHSELAFTDLKEMNTIGPTYNGQMGKSTSNQQYIMTSVNNLALMLSEILNQMQQQQMQAKSGKGSCKKPKPGKGNSSVNSMREMQEALQKQMEQMKQQMDKPGGKKDGKGKPGGSGEQLSEEMARMAAQQEALRKMLQEYRDQLAKQGNLKEASSLGETARQMEQNETDLVNKILTSESLKRQKDIITRLLESEKAEREREQNEERESKEGKSEKNSNKNLIIKYKEIYEEDIEVLRTIPPELRPFYKRLVNSYFSY